MKVLFFSYIFSPNVVFCFRNDWRFIEPAELVTLLNSGSMLLYLILTLALSHMAQSVRPGHCISEISYNWDPKLIEKWWRMIHLQARHPHLNRTAWSICLGLASKSKCLDPFRTPNWLNAACLSSRWPPAPTSCGRSIGGCYRCFGGRHSAIAPAAYNDPD